jgi:hypothetical protein
LGGPQQLRHEVEEGASGGWFHLALGKNYLNAESNTCTFAVPAATDVARAVQQYDDAVGISSQ